MNRTRFGRLLLVGGTGLLILLLALPCILSVVVLFQEGVMRFDYLVTSELGFVALCTALLLLCGTLLARTPYLLLVISFPFLLVSLFSLALLSDPPPVLAAVLLIVYNLSLVTLLVHGILSLR